MAAAFIEKLEAHLATVRSIPQIPLTVKNMVSNHFPYNQEWSTAGST